MIRVTASLAMALPDVKFTITHKLVNGDKVVTPVARFLTKNVDRKGSKGKIFYEKK